MLPTIIAGFLTQMRWLVRRQLGVANVRDLQALDLSNEHTLGVLKLKKLELKRLVRLLS